MNPDQLNELLKLRSSVEFNTEKGIAGGTGIIRKDSVITDEEYKSYCAESGMVDENSEEAKAVAPEKVLARGRILRFIGSTESPDRHGDVVRLSGWDTVDYMKNPVFLLGHDASKLPIGKTLKVWPDSQNKNLMFDVFLPPASVSEQADQVHKLYVAGILKGVSVGFKPVETYVPSNDVERVSLGLGQNGIEFRKQNLLELSAVSIPANGNALIVNNSAEVEICKSLGFEARLESVDRTQKDTDRISALEESMKTLISLVTKSLEPKPEVVVPPVASKNTDAEDKTEDLYKFLLEGFETVIKSEPTAPTTPENVSNHILKSFDAAFKF